MGALTLIVIAFIAWAIYKLSRKGPRPLAAQPDWRAERRKRQEVNRREDAEKQKKLIQVSHIIAPEILGRNSALIDQFLQIAERKIAVLDEYGDEDWAALDAEILRCIEKIANAERASVSCPPSNRKRDIPIRPTPIQDLEGGTELERELARLKSLSGRGVVIERSEQYAPQALYSELFYSLEQRFRSYHNQQSSHEYTSEQFAQMTGVEFESYLMRILAACGCAVSGTPKTGDKGADIIARLPSRTIVIQAKRSSTPVGNGAVQEVVAALAYYRGTEAWVISNSTFTAAARELAQCNRVRLVCGADLRLVGKFIEQQ
ncbi:MAG TPA: restriction endonuclease [Bryobacteraceae bacterium]|nr:restriction endonuclease [Bryobacteraceae bacterium]